MTLTLRSLAAVVATVLSLTATAVPAAQNSGSQPTVAEVCFIAYDLCTAGCNAANPDSGLNFNEYISNQVCMRQCVDQLNECIATSGDGSGSPARKFSVKKLRGALDLGLDGGSSSTPNNNPAGSAKPPAETSGGDGDGKGGDTGGNGGVFDMSGKPGNLNLFSPG